MKCRSNAPLTIVTKHLYGEHQDLWGISCRGGLAIRLIEKPQLFLDGQPVDAAAPFGGGAQARALASGFEHRFALRVIDPSLARMAAMAAAARAMEVMA